MITLSLLIFLCFGAGAGLTAGVLSFLAGAVIPAAVLAGLLVAGPAFMWVFNIDWPRIATRRGAVLVFVSILFGTGIGVLTCMTGYCVAAGILAGVPVFKGALLALDKIVY
ncbi:hypothetical protein AB0M12_40245 [Nocardia vinacea]|uniref:hypothetical protein n=1 Tax=Nocardia vinacea TaxID=96468 RepID=UPI0034341C45